MYKWVRQQQIPAAQRVQQVSQSKDLRRLKAELKRVTEERDILKKAAAHFARQFDRSTPLLPGIRRSTASCECAARYSCTPTAITFGRPIQKAGVRLMTVACWACSVSDGPTHLPSTSVIHQDRVHVIHRALHAPKHSPPRYSAPRTRRSYSPQFKAHLVDVCERPGASVAAPARENSINADVLHRWR